MKQKYVSLRYKILINHSLVTKIRCAMLATKIWRLCRSLVNARGASYSLEFSEAEIDTEDIIQQPQQHVLSTTFRSPTSRAARVILFRDAGFFLNKNTGATREM